MNKQNKQNDKLSNENKVSVKGKNKPQPNIALEKGGGTDDPKSGIRDTGRISSRANEASDRNDSNTGGMISGGAKGASQS